MQKFVGQIHRINSLVIEGKTVHFFTLRQPTGMREDLKIYPALFIESVGREEFDRAPKPSSISLNLLACKEALGRGDHWDVVITIRDTANIGDPISEREDQHYIYNYPNRIQVENAEFG